MIKPPKKKYTPKQDVQLGKETASEVRKQSVIEDQHIAKYLTQIGNRLVAAAPTELKQSVYEYTFTPVNLKDINAFALPGGPMFVQRGMFDAAAEEAEVGGVMAHELSRVLLRHRLNKTATWFQMALFWSTNFFNRISYLYAGSFVVSAISSPVGSSS